MHDKNSQHDHVLKNYISSPPGLMFHIIKIGSPENMDTLGTRWDVCVGWLINPEALKLGSFNDVAAICCWNKLVVAMVTTWCDDNGVCSDSWYLSLLDVSTIERPLELLHVVKWHLDDYFHNVPVPPTASLFIVPLNT